MFAFFFEPSGADGFVNRVGQHAKFCADGWNFHSRIETDLDFLKALLRRGRTLRRARFLGCDYFPFFKTDMAFRARSSTT